MEFIKDPMAIEVRSFEIIKPYIEKLNLSEEETKIYSRIIHASGDVDYAPIIRIHKDVVASMKKALLSGCKIYTDVEMVRTGINKRKLASWGGSVECKIADPEIAKYAKEHGITRSIAAMRHFGKELDGAIVAIGNAPTALYKAMEMRDSKELNLDAIVGVPVGFVGAAESKEAFKELGLPYITINGRKGGSTVAVSILHGILYQMYKREGF